ncbi:hypothetical protein LCGC14_1072890 [marine sediment metagenome]|uniref:Phage terminase large subunit N-terminal domain-containing protein n=1 Tax=marine sediment metagenome TaxID=412755 RepID=A0A0F9MMK5_9ZZZZ
MPKTKVINIKLDPYQWGFLTAVNRFPSMIAGVGTGKTMLALQKGDLFSRFYKNNLGLVVRNKFTDLRDSTMKDFTDWTGKSIPQGTKEAHYANGSVVLFRHAKELSGLKNVNLGWAYIEQAEEFPTDTQFQLLRFRLRRELKIDEEYWAAQIAAGEVWPHIQYMYDHPLNQLMTIANANGHNWCWKMFIKSPGKEFSCVQANSFENTWLVENKPKTVEDWRQMEFDSPAKHKQFVMNCHDEVDLDACYYISIMNKLRSNDHICHVSYDSSVRVHLSFDIGLDCTAIWFLQIVRGKRNIIDYYENTGKFVDHYAKILDSKGYNYGKLVLPHDGRSRSKVSGESYAKALKDLGYDVIVNPKIGKDIGINIVADALPSFYFDENNCKDGLEALDHYRREYDEENRVYRDSPLHDWSSHPADSLKEMCQALKSGLLSIGGITKAQINKWNEKYRRTG